VQGQDLRLLELVGALGLEVLPIRLGVASALFIMNGSSKTSMRGKRPAVLPGKVQTMSTTPSRAWS
jgi:hypothetical protein